MQQDRQRLIRELFDEYIEMYAARDERLTRRFSQNFTGYAGSGQNLVRDHDEWVRITRQDFAQVPGRIGIEMLDLALQDLADDLVLALGFSISICPRMASSCRRRWRGWCWSFAWKARHG